MVCDRGKKSQSHCTEDQMDDHIEKQTTTTKKKKKKYIVINAIPPDNNSQLDGSLNPVFLFQYH